MATALLLAACSAERPEGAQLRVTVVGDSAAPGDLGQRLVAEATGRTLIAHDGSGQLVAGLASSWRFVDAGRSLILRLRPEKWSDGKPLKSSDVVAGFRRAALRAEPAVLSSGLAGAADVAAKRKPSARLGVMAPIARVVELRLEAASPLLLGWLAEPGMAVTRREQDATLGAYAATGPAARQMLKRRALVAAPDARPAEIIVVTTPDSSAAIAGFMNKKSDIVIGNGLAGLGEARTVARPETLRIDPLWGVYGYRINSRRAALADPLVRLALAMAVDRRPLAARFGVAALVPAEGLLPAALRMTPAPSVPPQQEPAQPQREPAQPQQETAQPQRAIAGGAAADIGWARLDQPARLAEARRLLAAAGFTAENPLRLVLLLPPGRDHARVAEAVAADWAAVGVRLGATTADAAMIDRRVKRGDFDLAVSEASVPVPDAGALLAAWRCAAGASHCNPAADVLLDAARAAPPAARPRLLAAAEAALMAGPPLVPLLTPVRWALVAKGVDGWVPNRAARHPLGRLVVR